VALEPSRSRLARAVRLLGGGDGGSHTRVTFSFLFRHGVRYGALNLFELFRSPSKRGVLEMGDARVRDANRLARRRE
jgi:hypothetical protein